MVAINHPSMDSAEVSYRLDSDYNIAVRAGTHCAPLMHKTLGTEQRGVVRFSFSHFNTKLEVEQAVEALKIIDQRG